MSYKNNKISQDIMNIINTMSDIRDLTKKLQVLHPNEAFKDGEALVKLVTQEPKLVNMTPYLKNALVQTGEITGDAKLLIDAPMTKAERGIINEVKMILLKHFGSVELDYDKSLPADHPDHARVDAWRNFYKMGREVTPRSAKRRVDSLKKYLDRRGKHTDLISLLKHDPLYRATVQWVFDQLPSFNTAKDFVEVSMPFQTKHTNVGYPFFRNDKTIDPKTGKSYADITMDAAKITPVEVAVTYPGVELGRDQRGGWTMEGDKPVFKDSKARFVCGTSRITNLILNQAVAPEIEAYKNTKLYIGYNSSEVLRKQAEKDLQLLELPEFSDYTFENYDVDSMDTNVTEHDQLLSSAMSYHKIRDAKGKKLILYGATWMLKMGVITTEGYLTIVEAIKSGAIRTNLDEGKMMATCGAYAMLLQDPEWIRVATAFMNKGGAPVVVMGDDLKILRPKKLDQKKFTMNMFKFFNKPINPLKGEYGWFFLQWRAFTEDGKVKFIMPAPRAISKVFWVERPKGLGPFGWTVATYMKLYVLLDFPELLADIVRLIAKYDDYKLGTVIDGKPITPDRFKAELKRETEIAEAEGKITAHTSLYDGDPNKMDVFWDKNGIKDDFIHRMFKVCSDALKGNVNT